MATITYEEIGPGKTHANLKTFATWLQSQNLVTQDKIVVGRVFANQGPTDLNVCLLYPQTFSSSCYCIVEPAPGLGVNELDPTGALDYGTQGIELTVNYTPGYFRIGHGVELRDFRINCTGTGSASHAGIYIGPHTNAIANNVRNATLTRCRIKSAMTIADTYTVYTGQWGAPVAVTDNLFIHDTAASAGGGYAAMIGLNSSFQRNTFVRRNGAVGTSAGRVAYAECTVRDNVFIDAGSTPIVRTSNPATCSNNFSNTAIVGTATGFLVDTASSGVANKASDLRPADAGPLIGAASSASVSVNDIRGNNRGLSPDIGAVQLSPAIALPTCEITSQTLHGQSLVISGTTTGTVVSGTVTLPVAATPNGATAIGPVALTLGSGTFSVTLSNIVPGNYAAPEVRVANTGGASAIALGGSAITILGISGSPEAPAGTAPTVAITSATASGQHIVASGTVNMAGDANGSLSVYLEPAVGASQGPFVVTPSGGNWNADLIVPSAGVWRVRAVAVANSNPTSVLGSALTVLGVSGDMLLPV